MSIAEPIQRGAERREAKHRGKLRWQAWLGPLGGLTLEPTAGALAVVVVLEPASVAKITCTCATDAAEGQPCGWPSGKDKPEPCRHHDGCPVREDAKTKPPEGCCRRLMLIPPP